MYAYVQGVTIICMLMYNLSQYNLCLHLRYRVSQKYVCLVLLGTVRLKNMQYVMVINVVIAKLHCVPTIFTLHYNNIYARYSVTHVTMKII